MGFGVHDRFVDLGGSGSEARDAHEVAVARGGEGGLADLAEFVPEALDLFGSDFRHILFRWFKVLLTGFRLEATVDNLACREKQNIGPTKDCCLKIPLVAD